MKLYHTADLMMKSVVRLTAVLNGNEIGTGTGFFMQLAVLGDQQAAAIITNKHVVAGADSVRFVLTHYPAEYANILEAPAEALEYSTFEIPLAPGNFMMHPSPDVDLCCIFYSHFLDSLRIRGRSSGHAIMPMSMCATDEVIRSIAPLETVAMIGYPSGLWDKSNNGAIARRGVLATSLDKDFNGLPVFVVDMACFPGSSGSPVFVYNEYIYRDRVSLELVNRHRCHLLGVLYAGPVTGVSGKVVIEPIPMNYSTTTNVTINLGYVVKASELHVLAALAEGILLSQRI